MLIQFFDCQKIIENLNIQIFNPKEICSLDQIGWHAKFDE